MLSDFGLTAFADAIEERDLEVSTSLHYAGSPQWMAVELCGSNKPGLAVTKYSDMWAFAMTVIEVGSSFRQIGLSKQLQTNSTSALDG